MIKILIPFIAIAIIFLIRFYLKSNESFECKENPKQYKQDTIDTVLRYPHESIDPLFDAVFKPECCPNTYTRSSGCICYEPNNFNLLATRGGNAMNFMNKL